MKQAILLTVFAFAMVFSSVANASAQTSVAGEWDALMNTPGGSIPLKLIFVVDGEKITGTAKRSRGDVAITGTIKGSDIAFSYTIDYNGNAITMSFSGKVDGDKINGAVSFNGGNEESWAATRVKSDKPKE
ncbi:MAG TPA: hypothetical protein PKA82_16180 [Pyrinomonadaceae bacterium]|nr:hypothetical protein [Pyrinomonadaceae bacterium]